MKVLEYLKEIDQSNADLVVMHEKSERKFAYHNHEKAQLSYVEDGIAYVTFENHYWVVPARHFLWIPANTPHVLKVSHSAIQLHSFYFKQSEGDFYRKVGIYPASNLIIELIKFSEQWQDGQFINFSDEHAHIFETLYKLLPLASDEPIKLQLPISDDEKVDQMTQYIQDKFNTELTLEQMTRAFNMSERTFCRVFKKSLHTTFLQYLKTYRVIKAIELLRNQRKSIEEIANDVGYESLPAFSNLFVEFTGVRPSEMRKHIT